MIHLLTQALVATRERLSSIASDGTTGTAQQQQEPQDGTDETLSFIDDSMKLQQQIQLYCRSNRNTRTTSTYDMMDTDEDADDIENLMEGNNGRDEYNCTSEIYSQPIRLGQFGASSAVTTTVASLETHLACIMFNLGLAHHTMGGIVVTADDEQEPQEEEEEEGETPTVTARTRRTSLQKATKLYELAYTLIANTNDGTAAASTLSNPMFVVAILNNMAVCNGQLQEHEISNHLFEQLLSLVMLFIENGGVHYSDAIMQLFGNFLFDNLSPVIFGATTNSIKLLCTTANAA